MAFKTVLLKHKDTGAKYRVPENMVQAAQKAGFEPVENAEPAPQQPEPEEEDLSALSKDELQERLHEVGLPVSGNKDELVARLQATRE